MEDDELHTVWVLKSNISDILIVDLLDSLFYLVISYRTTKYRLVLGTALTTPASALLGKDLTNSLESQKMKKG